MNTQKIYGGIYSKGPAKITDQFIMDPTMTILENKLAPYYLWETIVHNLMLAKKGITPKEAAKKILSGLIKMMEDADKPGFIDPINGDVHENVEKKLTKMIGSDAGWFHVARSRNDQTVVDQKLFTKKMLLDIFGQLDIFETILLDKSEKYKDTIMPGFTHLRSAMPSSFGFWWQAYLDQSLSIYKIMKSIYEIYDVSPLGAGASYGVNWKIDTEFTAKKLGFSSALNNALSAINNRGIEDAVVISMLSVLLVMLSRMMEDLIIWSLPDLNYIAIAEEFTTGSSIMPQKMNPDIAEKIRSKSAKLIANLNHVLISMKGTPSGYNRDSAESKIAVMASLEETVSTISIANEMLAKVVPNNDQMKKAVISSLPTKLADELVKNYGIPFRTAHKIVGKTVALVKSDLNKVTIEIVELAIKEITGSDMKVNDEIINNVFNVNNALRQYEYEGAAGPDFISKINKKLSRMVADLGQWTAGKKDIFNTAEKEAYDAVQQFINS